jgi:hypothetical protein
VGFVVDKAALGQVFSEYFDSTNFSIIVITRGWHNRPIDGRSAEWTQLASNPHYTNLKEKTVTEKSGRSYLGRNESKRTFLIKSFPHKTQQTRKYQTITLYITQPKLLQ